MSDSDIRRALEYRVIWQREGLRKKVRTYKRLSSADRMRTLISGTPEERLAALRHDPDEHMCCSGMECGCRGLTYREDQARYDSAVPKLLYCVIEEREVGPWGLVLRP